MTSIQAPPSTSAPLIPSSTSSPSSKKRKQCQTCSQNAAIYTCPRCGFQSCSLSCTNAHKYAVSNTFKGPQTTEVCSGVKENNAGGYVNMEEYGYSAFVTDYVFLEDIGRRASEWGRNIQANLGGTGNNMQRHPKTKRDILKERLEELSIEMELLPQGMQRRKVNQSTWDSNSQKAFLTIGYRFHRQTSKETVDLLTHRNELGMRIGEGLRKTVAERKKGILPDWVRQLVGVDEDGTERHITKGFKLSMRDSAARDLTRSKLRAVSKQELIRGAIKQVDDEATLEQVLRGSTFVEYPVFEVASSEDFTDRRYADEEEEDISEEQEEGEVNPQPKRRKLDEESGRRLLGGLAVYGSDEEASDDEQGVSLQNKSDASGLGVLQGLDYESDKSEEEEEEEEKDEVVEKYDATRSESKLMDALRRFDEGNEDLVDWEDE